MIYGSAASSSEPDILDPNSAAWAPTKAGRYHCSMPLLLYNQDRSVHLCVPPSAVGYEGLCASIRENGTGQAKAYFVAVRQGGNVNINFGEVLPMQPW